MSNAGSHVVKLTPAAHAVNNELPIVEMKASLSATPEEMLNGEEAIMKAALGNAKDARAAVKEAATKKEVKKKRRRLLRGLQRQSQSQPTLRQKHHRPRRKVLL